MKNCADNMGHQVAISLILPQKDHQLTLTTGYSGFGVRQLASPINARRIRLSGRIALDDGRRLISLHPKR